MDSINCYWSNIRSAWVGNNYQYGTGRLGGARQYNNSQNLKITFEFTTGNSYFIPKVSDGNINWLLVSGMLHLRLMSGCYQTN